MLCELSRKSKKMSISFPLSILDTWPGWTTKFELLYRQEKSRQKNGVTRVKDFGTPLWTMAASTRSLSRKELDQWRARLESLEGSENTIKGYSLSRCWPIAYPGGAWPTGDSFDGISATVFEVGSGGRSLRVDLLPAGYVLSEGDMISVATASGERLFRVLEEVTCNGSGVSPEFDVIPHLPADLAVNDQVRVTRPFCLMTMDSASTESDDNGRGRVSFQATEYR